MRLLGKDVMGDLERLTPILMEASRYVTFGLVLPANYLELVNITIEKSKKTPTGRDPKYPYTAQVDLPERVYEPDDWDSWIDDYVASRGGDAVTPAADRFAIPNEITTNQGSVIINLAYLPSGEIGKVNYCFWQNNICLMISARTKNGSLVLQEVSYKHLDDRKKTLIYKRK